MKKCDRCVFTPIHPEVNYCPECSAFMAAHSWDAPVLLLPAVDPATLATPAKVQG